MQLNKCGTSCVSISQSGQLEESDCFSVVCTNSKVYKDRNGAIIEWPVDCLISVMLSIAILTNEVTSTDLTHNSGKAWKTIKIQEPNELTTSAPPFLVNSKHTAYRILYY